jgi:hypothetical protein
MKKIILSMAVATFLFASCAKETTTSEIIGNPDAIGFDFTTGKTRATVIGSDELNVNGNGKKFGIYATKSDGEAVPAQVEAIANQNYLNTSGTWAWEDTTDPSEATWKEWPTEQKYFPMNFYAYYPIDATYYSTSLELPGLSQSFIIPAPDKQQDLMAAYTSVANRPTSSNVTLNFQHILSQVKFQIIVGSNLTAEIQSVALRNVSSTDTYSYSSSSWTGSASAPVDYVYLAKVNPATEFPGNGSTAAAINGTNGVLMLLPQDLSTNAWKTDDGVANEATGKSYIEVVYRMYLTAEPYTDFVGFTDASKYPNPSEDATLQGKIDAAGTGHLFVKVAYSLPTGWAKGKAYTYTLYLGTPDASGGNLDDGNFVDENGGETELPVVDPSTDDQIDPNDPIVDTNKPIGFEVDVTGWDGETTTDPLK